jgi:hypothetical protein
MEVEIGRPPEFGPNGAWPPMRSAPTVIARWEAPWPSFNELVSLKRKGLSDGEIHTRFTTRLFLRQFWMREDPPTQLAPGASSEAELSYRVGLTRSQALEIANVIGISLGVGEHMTLTGQSSGKSTVAMTVAVDKTVTRRIKLSNPMDGSYRLIALWHVYSQIMRMADDSDGAASASTTEMAQIAEFVASDALVTTSIDLPIQHKA